MLKARIITALLLLAAFLTVAFVLPPLMMALAFGLLAAIMAWEWAGLTPLAAKPASPILGQPENMELGITSSADKKFHTNGSASVQEGNSPVIGASFIFLVVISCGVAYRFSDTAFVGLWLLSAAFWLAIAPLWLWRRWQMTNPWLAALVGWVLIVPTWAAMVALCGRNPWWLFGAMALVWVADIAAYFAGRRFGKHKLAPAISPGKTWEGVAGAVLGVTVYAIALAMIAGHSVAGHWYWLLPIMSLTALSIIGDLFESLIKRLAGAKDSGTLLPGHGGFLDRLDSQTSTLPLTALLLTGVNW